MNLEDFTSINHEEPENRLAIRVIADEHHIYAIWIEKCELKLEFLYSKDLNKLLNLDGSIGEQIQKALITNEQKIERCGEALSNGLWNYFHNFKNTI